MNPEGMVLLLNYRVSYLLVMIFGPLMLYKKSRQMVLLVRFSNRE